MTTVVPIVPMFAAVLPIPEQRGPDPAPVQVCFYCNNSFQPTLDPDDGSLWDTDDLGRHCCDDCHCGSCLTGHDPDQDSCPSSLEAGSRDLEIAACDEAAVYGDPDTAYDALNNLP